MVPAEAEVQPGEDMKVTVLFRPDHERVWPYHEVLKVHVPNQAKTHYLSLSGRCHARQMYAVAYDGDGDAATQQPEEREDPFLVNRAGAAASTEGGGGGGGEGGGEGGVAVDEDFDSNFGYGERPVDVPTIKLTFPRDDPAVEREVTVGCIAIADDQKFKGSGGAFELEWVNNQYFKADVDKGSCNPGDKATIKFTFQPPEIGETYGLDVGQWERTTVKIKLTSGFAHEHASTAPVEVLLEGYIPI